MFVLIQMLDLSNPLQLYLLLRKRSLEVGPDPSRALRGAPETKERPQALLHPATCNILIQVLILVIINHPFFSFHPLLISQRHSIPATMCL